MSVVVKYKQLCSLSLEQPFYENNICPDYDAVPRLDYSILPTEECLQVMNRINLMFKKSDRQGGGTVYAQVNEVAGPTYQLCFKPKSTDVLTFAIVLNNSDLLNFNSLPLGGSTGKTYYFSNRVADAAAPRTSLHLSTDPNFITNADQFSLAATLFRYTHSSAVASGSAIIKHLITGKEVPAKTIVNEGTSSNLLFDLSALPAGRCELNIASVPITELYYPGKSVLPGTLGFIELSLDTGTLANYRIAEPDFSLTTVRPAYKVVFRNRSTRWRYILLLKENSPLYKLMAGLSAPDKVDFINRMNIVANDTTLAFTLNTVNDFRFEFTSNGDIALHEKYWSSTISPPEPLNLSLKKYIGDPREAEVRTHLPYPSTSILDTRSDPTFYSDILITL